MCYIVNVLSLGQGVDTDSGSDLVTVGRLVVETLTGECLLDHWSQGVSGKRYLLMMQDESGYRCSCPYVDYREDEGEVPFVRFPSDVRFQVEEVLKKLKALSPIGRIVFYLESNGTITSPPDSDDPYPRQTVMLQTVEGLPEFWAMHDCNQVVEGVLYFIGTSV
jgi:hypothetical protein